MTTPASPLMPRALTRLSSPLCRWLPAVTVLVGTMLTACGPTPNPYFIDREQAIRDNRFLRAIHSPDPVEEEEPPPADQENSDEQAASSGQRHKGEEGRMGKPTSRSKSGLYAMKGPRDAVPQMARNFDMSQGQGFAASGCTSCDPGLGDRYAHTADNPWSRVLAEPLSTFSIDVDTASYSNVRRFLQEGSLPPPDAVRSEELINYFDYNHARPHGADPLAVHAEVAPCPWNPSHKLVQLAVQGQDVPRGDVGPRNLVFLVDVSGSMSDELPLLRQGLRLLVNDLDERDRISIVAYAGASGLVLPSTSGADKQKIRDALDQLEAGGSTNGGQGIALAYAQAREHFVQGGVNRVLLASDGDFNVGVTDHDELIGLIEQQRKSGVFLSVLGFGRGNLNDATMEQLADKGNGNYAYIDSAREARKVLVEQAAGTLVTIASDVKLQVEWNPSAVSAYRLIGYDNRRLAAQDFKDDRKDAGELGSGHTVTSLYEVVPVGVPAPGGAVDPLRFQRPVAAPSGELFAVKLRYKRPGSPISTEIKHDVITAAGTVAAASSAFRLAAAVAAFAERLKAPQGKDGLDFAAIYKLAASVELADPHGHRKEFLELVRRAEQLSRPAGADKLADAEYGARAQPPA